MHGQCIDFVDEVLKGSFPSVRRGRVIEWGSLNINGSVRQLFPDATEYVGVDVTEGPGVDWVGWAHEFPLDEVGEFDVSVTTEMLEHDPFWEKSVAAMVSALREGGLLVGTCAGPGRAEHGTARKDPEASPGISKMPGFENYYRNIEPDELGRVLSSNGMKTFNVKQVGVDLHFMGYK